MEVTIKRLTDVSLVRRACEMTVDKKIEAKINISKIASMEHSPLRCLMYWIELSCIPTFISVHLVRHKFGVDHFVTSKRDDRKSDKTEQVTRETPVNHGMLINAQALINVSRKRLCPASDKRTVRAWQKVRKEMKNVDKDIADHMVPECVYRGGICPEYKECAAGVKGMMKAYGKSYHPLQNSIKNGNIIDVTNL